MNKGLGRFLTGYVAPVAAMLASLLFRVAIQGRLGAELPTYITFYPFLTVVALLAGLRAGLTATATAVFLTAYWILPPQGWRIERTADIVGLVLFSSSGVFMSVVAEGYRRNRARVAAYEKTLALQRSEEALLVSELRWETALRSIGDAVITCDAAGLVTFLNPVGEALTGWKLVEAQGQPIQQVFQIVNERTGEASENIAARVLRERKIVALANHTALVTKDGRQVPIEDSAAPIIGGAGDLTGAVLVFHDVTDQRRAREALRRSEERVRVKLESILSPEGDIGALELQDIIDATSLQSLMDQFYVLTQIPVGILDLKGRVLVGAGWQDVCTKFHRVHPESCRHCVESDTEVTAGIRPGKFKLYRCKNNMWDVATPIMVGDRHVGNIFSGQFFFEDESPDLAMFRAQAVKFGFDEKQYLAAIERVPRLSRATVTTGMSYLVNLAQMISRLSYSNIKLAHLVAQREALTNSLRSNEARLRLALNAAKSGTWEWDLESNKSSWSEEMWALYGLEPHSCEPSFESWLAIIHPADRDAARQIVTEAARRGGDFNLEYRVGNGGEPRWFMACGCAVRDTDGRTVRFVGIVMDVSEHKRAEAALVRSEKLASLGRMAATVAHEINNPLAAIMNLLYLAKNSPDARSTQRFLDTADEELKRVSHITRQALGFYREGSVPAIVSIGEILDSTVELLQSRINARQATIAKQYDGGLQITAVAGELRQVVSNILANSLDAVDEKGAIKLRASHVHCPGGRHCIRLTVADNGRGIDPANRPQIFDALFTTKDLTGTGLGLWVTKQLVEKHGGSIRVRSATHGERRGTTISITLPAEGETAAPRARTQAAGNTNG